MKKPPMVLGLWMAGRRSAVSFLLGVLALVSLSGCEPGEQTETPPLPDLVIAIEAQLKSNPDVVWGDDCIDTSRGTFPLHVSEVTAHIRNVGSGDAGSFTVQLNDAATEAVDGLKAGASTTTVFSASVRSEHVAVVDAGSSISESDESNNTAQTFMLVPTIAPSPTCTP